MEILGSMPSSPHGKSSSRGEKCQVCLILRGAKQWERVTYWLGIALSESRIVDTMHHVKL